MSDPQAGARLPSDFFDRLTERQEALLRVLMDADGEYVRGVNIRQRMRDEHDLNVADHPGGIAGILSGLSRKYTEEFRRDVIPGRWEDDSRNHAEFKFGSKYEDELRDRLG